VLFRSPLDVTVEAERRAVVTEAEERWGGVDVLVNNAGLAWR
jgi:NAD(P)-dependent dehydrogenase (short-subunit alcohol dehydrogenase family)